VPLRGNAQRRRARGKRVRFGAWLVGRRVSGDHLVVGGAQAVEDAFGEGRLADENDSHG
jgi:hypothetical protein